MIAPLDGIVVVDLSRAIAGPYCTALLADMGADVIKVESVKGGDISRQWAPFEDQHSLYFESVNRNKRSVSIDFYSAEGRAVLDRLIEKADVLVENFKLGTLEQIGLTAERLEQLNPGLIVASVTGFGTTGPLKDDPGLDQVLQGMTGIMSVTGPNAGEFYRVGVSIIDITSGMICAFGVVSALLGRATGHPVRRVSTSMLETGLNLSVFQGQKALSLGETPVPQGNNHPTIAPYGTFATATALINIAVGGDRQFRAFCDLAGLPELAGDPRFVSGATRSTNRVALAELIQVPLLAKSADEWVALLRAAGIPGGPIYDYTQAFASEQVAAIGLVQHVTRSDGSDLPLVRGPISLNGEPSEIRLRPPSLGEHSTQILHDLGFDDSEIDQLAADAHVKR